MRLRSLCCLLRLVLHRGVPESSLAWRIEHTRFLGSSRETVKRTKGLKQRMLICLYAALTQEYRPLFPTLLELHTLVADLAWTCIQRQPSRG